MERARDILLGPLVHIVPVDGASRFGLDLDPSFREAGVTSPLDLVQVNVDRGFARHVLASIAPVITRVKVWLILFTRTVPEHLDVLHPGDRVACELADPGLDHITRGVAWRQKDLGRRPGTIDAIASRLMADHGRPLEPQALCGLDDALAFARREEPVDHTGKGARPVPRQDARYHTRDEHGGDYRLAIHHSME